MLALRPENKTTNKNKNKNATLIFKTLNVFCEIFIVGSLVLVRATGFYPQRILNLNNKALIFVSTLFPAFSLASGNKCAVKAASLNGIIEFNSIQFMFINVPSKLSDGKLQKQHKTLIITIIIIIIHLPNKI